MTMKSLKYLLISLFSLATVYSSSGCWYDWYTPNGYRMYRVCEADAEPTIDAGGFNRSSEKNCRAWQRLTSNSIPLKDIYDVVYKMPLTEFVQMYNNRNTVYENQFAQWITKRDTSILEFLYVAKNNEYVRAKRNSRWYYPTMNIDAPMTLEQVVERSIAAKKTKLGDRYLLQAVRALFSLGRYSECIDIWNKYASKLPKDNLMRQLILPYIAGAEYRVNNSERALEYLAEIGDVHSILYCKGRAGEQLTTQQALELVCQYAPNSDYVVKTLQEYVNLLESDGTENGYYRGEPVVEPGRAELIESLRALCLSMAVDSRVETPALWYYTAAILSDIIGESQRASQLLSKAQKAKSTRYLDESMKVMRIYLDAKLSKYDSAYEAKLYEQLRWLDSKIVNNITKNVRTHTIEGFYLNSGIGYYYWNDMMRRIVLSVLCPRLVQIGKTTRAMQLANMADNRLLGIVDSKNLSGYVVENGNWIYKTVDDITMREYRYAENQYNQHDYSNYFFELIDSLDVNCAIRYHQVTVNPKSDFDRFLNSRGYTGSDYINDIVGTHCLRQMRYKQAVKYLKRVSREYTRNHLNVVIKSDPFSITDKHKSEPCYSKYDFATQMYALEQSINRATDPNAKARDMFKFAVGLRNSFGRCWSYTQYYKGELFWGCVSPKRDWQTDKYTTAAKDYAQKLFNRALTTANDSQLLSEMNYNLCNFKTVAEKYPDTELGIFVRGSCDKLVDYKVLLDK